MIEHFQRVSDHIPSGDESVAKGVQTNIMGDAAAELKYESGLGARPRGRTGGVWVRVPIEKLLCLSVRVQVLGDIYELGVLLLGH